MAEVALIGPGARPVLFGACDAMISVFEILARRGRTIRKMAAGSCECGENILSEEGSQDEQADPKSGENHDAGI